MKASTLIKRTNPIRKEIIRAEKEIKKYSKEKEENKDNPKYQEYCQEWINHYSKYITNQEKKIAEMLKQAAILATEEEKQEMIKAKAEELAAIGFNVNEGYTAKGLHYSLIHNTFGYTDRTAHCYTMRIEGLGTVFTSGTLETVAEYILKY